MRLRDFNSCSLREMKMIRGIYEEFICFGKIQYYDDQDITAHERVDYIVNRVMSNFSYS
jgi:hypothetical protein